MSEDCAWNPHWWREPKAASLERKRRAVDAAALAKPGDTFLIVTEGTVTEPVYFDLLRRDLQLPVIRIKVQPGDHSDPRHVIRTAEREAKEQVRKAKKGVLGIHEPAKFDHVWAVVDTDVAVRNDIWNDVQQLATAKRVTLAHSTPCFEFWLLLHLAGFTTRADLVDGDAAKSVVKHALGRSYSTNKETAQEAIASFLAKWPESVAHAEQVRRHHRDAATPQPANPSTEVDRLVRAMNDSAPEHLQRFVKPVGS
jgi:RloB-like protein